MAVTIQELEAKARINRTQWDADKSAILSDIQSLSRQLDQLGTRTTAARSGVSGGGNTQQTSAAIDEAAAATTRLTRAQREAADPVLTQARQMRTLQSDIRAYTLALGDADPRTIALVDRLNDLKTAQKNSGNETVTFTQRLGQLIETLEAGGGEAGGFSRGILQSVGGISLIAGGAAAAGAAVAKLAEAIVSLASQGIGGNAAMEQYTTSFKVLLGSADAAAERLKELTQFANVTPFNLPEIVEADRVLQTFGGDVLATGKNLTLVGDIASGTNRTFGEVAMWVGRAYDALQSGRPWGEAAQRLQEMGALSGDARARLEGLQASGASGTTIWTAFTQEMARFNGMMVEQSHTAAGLASTWGDMVAGALRTATKPAFEAAKQSLEGLTSPEMQHNLEATAQGIAKLFDAIGSGGSAIGAFTKGLGQLPLISQALQAVAFVFQMEGKGLDVVGQGFHYFGEGWNQMMTEITGGTPAVTAATDQIVQHFSDAELAADRTVNQLAVVWLDAANGAEQAAQRVAHAWDVGLVDSLKDLKTKVEGAFPDVNGTITQILALTDQTLGRVQGRMNSFGDTSTKIQEAYAAQLREGLQVLSDWQTGNLDACSEAANKWGSTAPEIIQHIRDIESELYNYMGALNQTKMSVDQLRTSQTQMRGGEGGPVDKRGTDFSIPRADNWATLDQTLSNNNQVSADTVQAQTQAAINLLKANNKAFQDATIQSDIAQAQASAAISRIKANNQALISASIDVGVAQTQAQTAITTAQGNNQAWINAQVAAEKAQQDAQDKLDIARKAAGLIDETAAEKRAHERQITKVEFVKQQAEDAAAIIKAGIDSITNLQSVHVPTNIGSKISQLTQFEDQVIQAQQGIASRFSKDQITQLYSFSQAANEGMGYFSQGVTALGQVSTLRVPDASQVERVLKQADEIVAQINKTAATYKTEDIVQAGVYAEQAQKITGFLSSTADAFAKLLPQRTDIRGQINLFFENLNHALKDFSIYSKSFKAYATDTARDIADNVGAVMDNLNKALEPLTKFNDLLNLDDSTIDLGFASIQRALDRFSKLADSPMLQGSALNKLKNASDTLGSVFTGLKVMTDTLTGLTSLADPTGTIDMGADLDQFFFNQVPKYADSWATAMDRIGGSSEVAGRRVNGALGTPGRAGAGGGNTYILNVNGNASQVPGRVGSLLKQVFDELDLAQGGVRVG